MALLTLIHRRTHVPVLSGLVLLAVVFAAFEWNDNHEVELQDGNKGASHIKTIVNGDLERTFRAWLTARKDLDNFRTGKRPYYVYVISAEGGGIFAAYRTANFLSRIQDVCPGFAQHVFGIVGVSGGSVGATVFSALSKELAENRPWRPCNPTVLSASGPDAKMGTFEALSDSILSNDLLSPLIWAYLFPDFLQRFLPIGIEAFDRARMLERGLERAWVDALKDSANAASLATLEKSYYDHWTVDGPAPALLLTTTDVEQGSRVVIRPFQHRWGDVDRHLDNPLELGLDEIMAVMRLKRVEPKLVTAAMLSARFPFVTPAGTITRPKEPGIGLGHLTPAQWEKIRRKARLADGGYFENSGVETAARLARSLAEIINNDEQLKGTVVIRLIALATLGEYLLEQESSAQKVESFSEFTSPVVTLLNSRSARGHAALMTALAEMNKRRVLAVPRSSDPILWAPLSLIHFPIPLGWQLSDTSRDYIRSHLADPAGCQSAGGPIEAWQTVANLNACVMRIVYDDLVLRPRGDHAVEQR